MVKYKKETIKEAVEKIMQTKNFDDIKELKTKTLQKHVITGIYDRLKSYTKFHFRKSSLSFFAKKTEALAYLSDELNIKDLSDTLREDKNQWLSSDLWKYINKNNDIIKNNKGKQ